jgi:TRAP-type C4-dicarboxylate transport system permease small subunit
MNAPAAGGLGARNGRAAMWLARAGAGGLAVIMVLTFCDVIGRYVFDAPIVGTVEVTELLMGMMVYLGVGLTTHARGHIRVDIVIDRLPPRVQGFLDVLTLAASIALVSAMCWHLWLKAGVTVEKNDLTQIWEWPVWPAAYVMAAASLLMVTSLVLQLGQAMRDLARGDNSRLKP